MGLKLPLICVINNVISPYSEGDTENKTLIGAYLKGKRKQIRFVTEFNSSGMYGMPPSKVFSALKFDNKKNYKKNSILVRDFDFDEHVESLFMSCKEGGTFSYEKFEYYKLTTTELLDYLENKEFYDGGTGAVLDTVPAQKFLKSRGIII